MRSYFKIYQQGTVFYPSIGEVPDPLSFGPDPFKNQSIWAVKSPHKQLMIDMLNYNYNNYIDFTYFGPDPTRGIAIGSISIGSYIFFEDYSLHEGN